MSITLTLPAEIEQRLLGQAAQTRQPVEEVALGLIVKALQPPPPKLTFDEILAPFRQEVAESDLTDDELESLFLQARRDYARESEEQE